jgi:hypothetical protein
VKYAEEGKWRIVAGVDPAYATLIEKVRCGRGVVVGSGLVGGVFVCCAVLCCDVVVVVVVVDG